LTDAEKIAEVARILDSTLSVEQKLATIHRVLHMETSRQERPALRSSTSWYHDDDPEMARWHTSDQTSRTDRPRSPHRTDPDR
jgi:hypothetical protein